jgi:uncharacterized protein (UPF0212 family)
VAKSAVAEVVEIHLGGKVCPKCGATSANIRCAYLNVGH